VQERGQLRQFVHVVASMDRRRFIKQLREQDQTVSFGQELKGPQYDREDFDAFLTDFRKVAMSDSEPIYLTKVMGTIGKFASDSLRSNLKQLRALILPVLEGRRTGMSIGYNREGEEVTLTPEQILNTLVNGEIFHVGPEHTSQAKELRGLQPLFYLWPTVHFFIMPIHRACVWLFHALWRDGIRLFR
jgi:hypothetical protein